MMRMQFLSTGNCSVHAVCMQQKTYDVISMIQFEDKWPSWAGPFKWIGQSDEQMNLRRTHQSKTA